MTPKSAPHYRKGIDNRRVDRGMTVADLAAAAGLSPGAISALLNGKTIPTARTINRVADALGMPVETVEKEVAR